MNVERCRDRSEPTESHERAIDQAHRQRDGEHNDQPYHDLRREAPATIANDAITTIKPARGPTETSIPPVRTTVACPRLMKPRAASSVRADPMLNSLRTRVFTLNVGAQHGDDGEQDDRRKGVVAEKRRTRAQARVARSDVPPVVASQRGRHHDLLSDAALGHRYVAELGDDVALEKT